MIDTLVEMRCLTPEELAKVITNLRELRGWSQEVLAECARLSVRTIQRVEKAEPSELDTRRALAKAFEWEDIDAFNKPLPFPNEEKIMEEERKLNDTTTLVLLENRLSGRKLRGLIEGTHAMQVHEYTELADEPSQIFAQLQDCIRDYMDVCCDLSAVDKIQIDKDFQAAIDNLHQMDITIGIATRRMKLSNENGEDKTPIIFSIAYLVAGNSKVFPPSIRVPKQTQIGF